MQLGISFKVLQYEFTKFHMKPVNTSRQNYNMHSTLRQEGTALGLLKKLSAKPRIGNLVNTFEKQKGNKNWNEGDERVIGLVIILSKSKKNIPDTI